MRSVINSVDAQARTITLDFGGRYVTIGVRSKVFTEKAALLCAASEVASICPTRLEALRRQAR